jgi:transcriptional regulator with XRE-family HTH domain
MAKRTPQAARFGARVHDLRRRQNLTLEHVSRATGIDKGDLSKIERGLGPKSIGMDRIARIAAALGVPPGALLDGGPEGSGAGEGR